MKRIMAFALMAISIVGCATNAPSGIQVVDEFDVNRYTGTWYEIYRLDHKFERGLSDVKATYTLKDDGTIRVENEGKREDGSRSYIEGRAQFNGEPNEGSLKVSFFGPFFSGYHIIALDQENYEYAMIAGQDFGYLWILSRTPQLDGEIADALLAQASSIGYSLEELVEVPQG